MFKRICTTLAMCLVAVFPANAKCFGNNVYDQIIAGREAALNAELAKTPYGEGRYWEVVKNGRRSVLIGTFHLADPRIAQISPAMQREIENASLLLMEFTEAEEARMTQTIQADPSLVFDFTNSKLKDELSEPEWLALVDRARAVGIPPTALNIMQPWFVGMSLALPACALNEMKAGKAGLDKLIENTAMDLGLPVGGLDRFEDLFAMLSEGTREEQLKNLRISLAMGGTSTDQLETSIQLYLKDRIAEIWLMGQIKVEEEMGKEEARKLMAAFHDALLKNRNQNWMADILPAVEEGRAVIAVGALHLGGEDGLLRLLEAQGFTVKRLSLSP